MTRDWAGSMGSAASEHWVGGGWVGGGAGRSVNSHGKERTA